MSEPRARSRAGPIVGLDEEKLLFLPGEGGKAKYARTFCLKHAAAAQDPAPGSGPSLAPPQTVCQHTTPRRSDPVHGRFDFFLVLSCLVSPSSLPMVPTGRIGESVTVATPHAPRDDRPSSHARRAAVNRYSGDQIPLSHSRRCTKTSPGPCGCLQVDFPLWIGGGGRKGSTASAREEKNSARDDAAAVRHSHFFFGLTIHPYLTSDWGTSSLSKSHAARSSTTRQTSRNTMYFSPSPSRSQTRRSGRRWWYRTATVLHPRIAAGHHVKRRTKRGG